MTMTRKNLTRYAAPGRYVAVCLLALGAGACDEEATTPIADASVQEIDADYIVWGMDNQLTLNGVRSGHVVADSAWGVRDSTTVRMTGVTMGLFNEQGLERAHVVANTGLFNQATEELLAWGDVVLEVEEQGVRIESSMLGYDPVRDEIWSDSVTMAVINGTPTQGTCFRSDLQFTGWSVCNPRGEIPNRPPGGDEGTGGTANGAGPATAAETGPTILPAAADSSGGGG